MATLKSIKNKYLASTDGATLGVSDNSENVALLAFKMQAADSIAKFNMVDGFSDAFVDASGIDTSASTEEVLTSGYYAATITIGNFVAKGGGEGGHRAESGSGVEDGFAGGSGGGGGSDGGSGHTTTGGTSNKNSYSGWTSYGNSGGTGQHVGGSHEGGGGGGGMSANGPNSSGGTGGSGGAGQAFTTAGSSLTYGGGGGAGGNSGGSGGSGGGGANGNAGGTNTGGGGGGGPSAQPGGTGIAWFRFTPSGGSITSNGVTSTGTWTVPANVTAAEVLLVGGGGGGGKGGSGGGGGGGQGLWHPAYPVTAGDVWTVTIGAGGAAGANDATRGSNGGDTSMALSNYAAAMSLVSNSATAAAQPTTADIVATYTNGAGTATLNTDIKYFVSRDNGTTYTEATMVSQGTTGGHTIVTARGIDISGQPAGTTMRYKVTTANQSASKSTRAQAVSLAWA